MVLIYTKEAFCILSTDKKDLKGQKDAAKEADSLKIPPAAERQVCSTFCYCIDS